MDRVVKCNNEQCGLHFMHTQTDTECPFCHTEYSAVEEKKVEVRPKERKVPVKTEKESFKIWKDDEK